MEWGLKRGWTNSFYCSEYELAIFRKGVESGRKALRNKIQSLQAELEAVKELLGQWLAGEESVSCKCRLCNDTRKLLKGR